MTQKIDNNKLRFWVPMELEKAKTSDGVEEMRIKGVASTKDKDADEEYLDPNGFDLSIFKSQGFLNWHHKASTDPSMIVGEPTKAVVTKKGLEIEGILYNDSPTAKSIYKLAEVLSKSSKTRRLGFSIEGKALERDPLNPKKVTKALITGCAITFLPKNPNTIMDIVKGEYEDLYMAESDEEINKLFKTPQNQLSKSEMFELIFDRFPNLPNDDAELLLNSILNNMKNSKKSKPVLEKEFSKALDTLGLKNNLVKSHEQEEEEEEFEEDDEDLEEEFEKGIATSEDDEEEYEEDEEVEEEEAPKAKKNKKVEKSINTLDILKAIEFQSHESTEMFRAIGTMLTKSHERIAYLEDRLEKAIDSISDFQTESAGRKSVKSFREKNFEKGVKDEFNQEESTKGGSTLSFSRQRKEVLDLIEVATFEKGYDPEFGSAMTTIEAGGTPSAKVLQRLSAEKGVTITA